MSVLAAYGAQMDRLRETSFTLAERMWSELPYYTDEAIPIWYERIGPVVRGAQTAAVTVHDAYLANILGDNVIGIDPEAAIARGSTVPFEEVHRTPFLRTWKHVAEGLPFREAVGQGGRLAGSVITEDVQRATLGANVIGLEHRPHVQAYRRVVSGSKTCKFCYDLAGRTYSREVTMKVHANCDCIVLPIAGREYVKTQAQRGVDRIDRHGRPVDRMSKQDELDRKKEAMADFRARQKSTEPIDLRNPTVS